MSSTMLNPSLEEFSFSDDDVPLSASTQKKTNAGNDIGVGCSGIGLERVSNQNKDWKTSLMDKGTMTENVNRKKAEISHICICLVNIISQKRRKIKHTDFYLKPYSKV